MTPKNRPTDNAASPVRVALVRGDVTVEWRIARAPQAGLGSEPEGTLARGSHGGAATVADLLAAVAPPGVQVLGPSVAGTPPRPDDPDLSHAWSVWKRFPGEPGSGAAGVWRQELDLGFEPARSEAASRLQAGPADEPAEVDLLVLHDAARGFRDRTDLWPRALQDGRMRPWIVLSTTAPVAEGALWDHLATRADRLVVVLGVDDLRRGRIQISRDLSWERTAQDLAWELTHTPLATMLEPAHVIVSLGTAGVFLLSRERTGPMRLLFDPAEAGDGGADPRAGGVPGATACLVAGLARRILLDPADPDLEAGAQEGIAAARELQRAGYRTSIEGLELPRAEIAAALTAGGRPLSAIDVPDPAGRLAELSGERPPRSRQWSILEDRYREGMESIAPRVAIHGLEQALPGVPVGRFGALLTVDRSEIESFRTVGTLVLEHVRSRSSKPLSIAVFGAPGSGKSFGVTQVARSLLPGRIEALTFNLSQFGGPSDLRDALHQVRDRALAGLVPLVFWDEFDTGDLAWLRHFLAPMQDGAFLEGQVSHPIGGAIFVFAGGTSRRLRDFGAAVDPVAFQSAKGPDFVSRLKGNVDVLGPNPAVDGMDSFWSLRRALLLRSLLARAHPGLFRNGELQIDPGVLRGLLWTRTFRHGARSMESILATSRLHGQARFDRSGLPPSTILDLHVDAIDFEARVQALELEGEVLERLAAANHDVHRDGLSARGVTSATGPDWSSLPDDEKEQNRGAVRDIANKLASSGYVMIPARSNEPPFEFPVADVERLAESEHERWVRAKLAAGWVWAPATDKPARTHASLVPWDGAGGRAGGFAPAELAALGTEPLSDAEREKDRDLVRGIPRILARAGYTVVPVDTPR